MAKWRVYYTTTAEAHIDVEAETEEDAWEEAEKSFDPPQVCWHCSKYIDLGDFMSVEDEYGTMRLNEGTDG